MASESALVMFCLLLFSAAMANAHSSSRTFNVNDYGAVADGHTDNTKAFEAAWSAACAVKGKPRLLIPGGGSYLLGPLLFKGPCNGTIMFLQLKGKLLASTNLNRYSRNWIEFQHIKGLKISGRGEIDGQGASAWPHNKCPMNFKCNLLPMSLVFSFVTDATISRISSINSKFFHMLVFASKNIKFRSINISAPEDSPNTDGIHIGDSTHVSIINSVIGTGDDCVSVGPGSKNITVANVVCGPGHGISVGSLGRYANEMDVVGFKVRNCTLNNTTNGIRIKTWESSASACKATDMVFEDIIMNNVYNPIIIDQKYCPFTSCNAKIPSLVKISDVKFQNIRGSSASPEAIKLVCSQSVPCQGIELSDIDLHYNDPNAQMTMTKTTCQFVNGISNGNVSPNSCI